MTASAIAHPVHIGTAHERAHPRVLGEAALAVVLVGALGLLLVQPWEAIPLPIVDFGGWLTILSSSNSAAAGFRGLVEEHAREGRVNVLSMAYVVLNWALFGAEPAGWQLLRAAVMLGVIGIGYVLFRRLGANRGAAVAGAAFFVISDSARSVWLLPQAIEHVATLFVLMASLLAASYHATPRPRRSAMSIAALLVLAVWVREPMLAAVPFVVLLALSYRGQGRLTMPRADRRSVTLVMVVGVAIAILNVIPVIAVRFLEQSTGYASRFGLENISAGNVENVLAALMLPVTREPLFPANAIFALMLVTAAVGATVAARRYRPMLLLAATLPLGAAAIYVMWPSFPGNYALPYVPGIALAFALALTALWEGSRIHRALAVGGTFIIVGYGALLAWNGRREYAASRLLDADMANAVSAKPASRLVVAVDDPAVTGGFGRGLAMYAKATRGQGPSAEQASDVDCAAASRLVSESPSDVTVLRVGDACATADLAAPTATLTRTAWIRDWKTLRSHRWVTAAALWHGAAMP